MNATTKFAVMLIIVILVSALTSYGVTIISNNYTITQSQQNPIQNDRTRLNFTVGTMLFDVNYGRHYVEVYVTEPVDNLTIIYAYTCLNGTESTRIVDYGSVIPIWDIDAIIYPGSKPQPYLKLGIPGDMVYASSKIIPTNETTWQHWGIGPHVYVIEAYGYT